MLGRQCYPIDARMGRFFAYLSSDLAELNRPPNLVSLIVSLGDAVYDDELEKSIRFSAHYNGMRLFLENPNNNKSVGFQGPGILLYDPMEWHPTRSCHQTVSVHHRLLLAHKLLPGLGRSLKPIFPKAARMIHVTGRTGPAFPQVCRGFGDSEGLL